MIETFRKAAGEAGGWATAAFEGIGGYDRPFGLKQGLPWPSFRVSA